MGKYSEFNPQPDKWRNDKRKFRHATESLELIIAKNYSTLGLPTVAIFPEMRKDQYLGIKVVAPTGPLKNFFEQRDTKQVLYDLMEEAVLDALAKKEEKRAGNDVQAATSVVQALAVTKPPRPIWDLNLKEIGTYFSDMKSALARYHKIKMKPKWPKLENGVVTELPTKLPDFDDVMEKILPFYSYIPQKKFTLGNLQWRLKLACAYLLMQYDMDPNTYALAVPENYEGKNFTMDDLRAFSEDVKMSAQTHDKKDRRKGGETIYNLNVEVNTEENVDDVQAMPAPSTAVVTPVSKKYSFTSKKTHQKPPPSPRSEAGPSRQASSVGPSPPPRSRSPSPQPMTSSSLPDGSIKVTVVANTEDVLYDAHENDDLFNLSRETGTPQESFDDENSESEFLAAIENVTNDDNKFRRMIEGTDLRKILSGNNDGTEEPILQVFNFDILGKGKAYRAHAHDGKVSTTKIAFTVDLNKQVEKLVGHNPVLKISNFKLYNGSFIVITAFSVVQMLDLSLGTPEYLTEHEYSCFKAANKTRDSLPQTPTMVSKKLTKRHVSQIEVSTKATRTTSQRLQRSKGSQ